MVFIDEKLSNRITNLSFIAACLVVGIHLGSGPWFITLTYKCAVPIFFFISGFLLAGGCDNVNWYKSALKKRIRTLLIPYVIICVGWYLFLLAMHEIAVRFAGANPASMQITWRTPFDVLGLFFTGGPYSIGMWYVRALFILVVASPIFVWLVKKSYLVCALMNIITFLLWAGYKWHASIGFSFSAWWDYFFEYGIPLYGIACFAFGITSRLRGWGAFFWNIVPSFKAPKWLVTNSFPLFVMHPMILYVIQYILKGIGMLDCMYSYSAFAIGVFILIPGCCALAQCIKLKLPRLSMLVFGGR